MPEQSLMMANTGQTGIVLARGTQFSLLEAGLMNQRNCNMKTYGQILIGLALCGLTQFANAETIPEPPAPKFFTDILDRTCDSEHVRVLKSATRREFSGMFNLSFKPSKSRSADHTVYYDCTDRQLSKKLKPGARLCGFEIPKLRTLPDTESPRVLRRQFCLSQAFSV